MNWIEKLRESREKNPLVWLVIFLFGLFSLGWGVRTAFIDWSGQKIVGKNEFVPPIASFTYEIGEDGLVKFINLSENAKSIQWDYGDGKFGGLYDTVHVYERNGTYDVKLKVKNEVDEDINIVSVTVENVELGRYVFSTTKKSYLPIEVYVDGNFAGNITKVYDGYPDCWESGCVTVSLPAGFHRVRARGKGNWSYGIELGSNWNEESYEFVKGMCKTLRFN